MVALKQLLVGGVVLLCLLMAFRVIFLVPHSSVKVKVVNNNPARKPRSDTKPPQEVTVGDAVRELRQKIDSLRGPVEELLYRLEPATPPPLAKLSPNHALVFHDRHDSIFVIMSSYKDVTCSNTIDNMFAKAKFPKNLHVGLVDQHTDTQPSCVSVVKTQCTAAFTPFCPTDQIRHREIPPQVAKGVSWARSVAAQQYRGEKYVLLIDSHTIFTENWDEKLLAQYEQATKMSNGQPAVVSYLPEIKEPEDVPHAGEQIARLCSFDFKGKGVLNVESLKMQKRDSVKKGQVASSHFLFTTADMLVQVPFDPKLEYIKDGTDFLFTARLWTNGFEFFEPSEHIVFRRKVATENSTLVLDDISKSVWGPKYDGAKQRMQNILKVESGAPLVGLDAKMYGLGIARSLAQFEHVLGIDLKNSKVEKNVCDSVFGG